MAIPEFELHLHSPTSTTKDIEVSINFATRSGMILQLNTNGHKFSGFLNRFDCSWLSRFPDENERI